MEGRKTKGKRGRGRIGSGRSSSVRRRLTDQQQEALVELVALVAPGDRTVESTVRAALDEPEAFVKRRAKAWQRDLEANRWLPWIALVGAMERRGRLVELERKAPGSELSAHIEPLLRRTAGRKAANAALADDLVGAVHDEAKLEPALKRLGDGLAPAELAVVTFGAGTDSYAVTIVPSDEVTTAGRLAKRAGSEVEVWKDAPRRRNARSKPPKAKQTVHKGAAKPKPPAAEPLREPAKAKKRKSRSLIRDDALNRRQFLRRAEIEARQAQTMGPRMARRWLSAARALYSAGEPPAKCRRYLNKAVDGWLADFEARGYEHPSWPVWPSDADALGAAALVGREEELVAGFRKMRYGRPHPVFTTLTRLICAAIVGEPPRVPRELIQRLAMTERDLRAMPDLLTAVAARDAAAFGPRLAAYLRDTGAVRRSYWSKRDLVFMGYGGLWDFLAGGLCKVVGEVPPLSPDLIGFVPVELVAGK